MPSLRNNPSPKGEKPRFDDPYVLTGVFCPMCKAEYIWNADDWILECGTGDDRCVQAEIALALSEKYDLNELAELMDDCREKGLPIPSWSDVPVVERVTSRAMKVGKKVGEANGYEQYHGT
jgi:hypothetical protein